MVWMYERGPEVLRLETRFNQASSEFELIWHRSDGTSESERFPTEATFRARLESVETALKSQQWNINGAPQILASGWRSVPPKDKLN